RLSTATSFPRSTPSRHPGDNGLSPSPSSSASCATTSRQHAGGELGVLPAVRRHFLRASSSGSGSSTHAAGASPKSPARSPPKAPPPHTAVANGGPRQYVPFSPAPIRHTPTGTPKTASSRRAVR